MTPALTLLIASSAGWAAPEARPTRLEVELLVAAVEMAVISETMATSTVAAADAPDSGPLSPIPGHPSPVLLPPVDLRALITYSLSLPWIRTKP